MPELMLRDLADTARLGKALAKVATRCNPGCILLKGPLGAGKTALAAALVRALPGGDEAEPSSPSFTICNIYDTKPPIHHFDLYRLQEGTMLDALAESFDEPEVLTIVEWPENMAALDAPGDGMAISLRRADSETGRLARLSPLGPAGVRCLDLFERHKNAGLNI